MKQRSDFLLLRSASLLWLHAEDKHLRKHRRTLPLETVGLVARGIPMTRSNRVDARGEPAALYQGAGDDVAGISIVRLQALKERLSDPISSYKYKGGIVCPSV